MKVLKNKESDDLDGKYIKSSEWTKLYQIFGIRDCGSYHDGYIGMCYYNSNMKECPRSEKKYVVLLDPSKKEYPYCYYHGWIVKDQG